jgi:hypothetical protein
MKPKITSWAYLGFVVAAHHKLVGGSTTDGSSEIWTFGEDAG